MTDRIILSVVSIVMLALTINSGNKPASILTAGLTLGILMTWSAVPLLITVGVLIYMLTALTISSVNMRRKEIATFTRLTIVLTGIWAFVVNLFSLMQWPFSEIIRLILIIPIALYIITLLKGRIKGREFGYMTIMNTEFLLRLIS